MQRQSHLTETVLSNKMNRTIIVLSFKDSPRIPLRRRPYVLSRGNESSLFSEMKPVMLHFLMRMPMNYSMCFE